MSCCLDVPVIEDNRPLVVDLHRILIDRVWMIYRASWGPLRRMFLKREKFEFEVPPNFFVFKEISQEITPRDDFINAPDSKDVAPAASASNGGVSGLLKARLPSNRELTNPEAVTLDTEFNNDTAERQLYKFRFEKTRRTDIEVTFQKGFTIGGKANFNIGLPVGLETEAQYQVTKTHGQRFEETLLMEATSDIAVGPNSCYTAKVELEEKILHANFKIVTRMSMPQGRAPVYIKRKSDGETVSVFYVNNLVDIFGDNQVPCAREIDGCHDQIDFIIQGVIKGTLACNHKIALKSNESDEAKSQSQAKYLQKLSDGEVLPREHESSDR